VNISRQKEKGQRNWQWDAYRIRRQVKKGSGAGGTGKRAEKADNMGKKAVGNKGREARKRRKSRLAGKT
jgi:hypothetical protein